MSQQLYSDQNILTPTELPPLPEELVELRQFVAWRYVPREKGNPGKKPINPHTGREASTSDPKTWGTLEEAAVRCATDSLAGVGFVFTEGDPFAGVDLDNCRNPATGELEAWAKRIVDAFDSYTEVSPTGTGVKIIVRGELPSGRNRRGPVEMYDSGRFFTLTGDVVGTRTAIEDRQEPLEKLHAWIDPQSPQKGTQSRTEVRKTVAVDLDDQKLLDKARKAKGGNKFRTLYDQGDASDYGSPSEADFALCGMLAFWTGRHKERMDRLFRASGLYRDKWERQDYREQTIDRAASRCEKVYTPKAETVISREVQGMLDDMKRDAVANPWTGRTGPAERWLYHALIDTGGVWGQACADGVIVAASSRDLAMKCGRIRQKVEDLLRRLEERGRIRCIEKGRGKKASKYLLIPQPCKGGHKEKTPPRGCHREGPEGKGGRKGDTPLASPKGCHKESLSTPHPTVYIYGTLLARVRDAPPQTDKVYDKNGRKIPQSSTHLLRPIGASGALLIEKVTAWGAGRSKGVDLAGLAVAMGREPSKVKRLLDRAVEGGFVVGVEGGGYVPADNLADLLLDHLHYAGCEDREKDLRARYERDRKGYERHLAQMKKRKKEADGYVEDLEPVPEASPAKRGAFITDANDPEQFKAFAALLRDGIKRSRESKPKTPRGSRFRWPYDPEKAAFYFGEEAVAV